MSLYVYVSGREGLLQAMLDRVTATIELEPPDPSRWRAQLHSLLARMHPRGRGDDSDRQGHVVELYDMPLSAYRPTGSL